MMAAKSIKRIGLEPEIISKLSQYSINTCQNLLTTNKLDLMNILQISYENVEKLLKEVCKVCSPARKTLLDLRHSMRYLRFSLPKLDYVLKGGIPVGSITEISGPAGSGKTQFCFLMSIQATLPTTEGGLDGRVIFIDTESTFSPNRLFEIAKHRYSEKFNNEEKLKLLAEKILICSVATCQSFKNILERIEMEIVSKSVKLVIIDSVASLVRKEMDLADFSSRVERSNLLTEQAAFLKFVSEAYDIPVLLTNQVTTRFASLEEVAPPQEDDVGEQRDFDLSSDSRGSTNIIYVTSALGTVWSHCVNTRFIVQYDADSNDGRRQILVAKSPVAPLARFNYRISTEGILLDGSG